VAVRKHGPAKRVSLTRSGFEKRASMEVQMPKLKTKSGAKKRFKFTATGKVKAGAAGKRHRLISHSGDYIRTNRGTKVLSESETDRVKGWMPYDR
jgi:large subunit ribosomal protein L35